MRLLIFVVTGFAFVALFSWINQPDPAMCRPMPNHSWAVICDRK